MRCQKLSDVSGSHDDCSLHQGRNRARLGKRLAARLPRRRAPQTLGGGTLHRCGAAALGGHQRAGGQRPDVAFQPAASLLVVIGRRSAVVVIAVKLPIVCLNNTTAVVTASSWGWT